MALGCNTQSAEECGVTAWEQREDVSVDSLGGYRLIRRLGVGSRSDVWLGNDGSETAAIKVFHEGASRDRIDSEIEALGRASGRHLLRLEDLAMGPDGVPCLILQRLSQWNLGRVLGSVRPSDGEAVTILAPLCLAVADLHRIGVAHGRMRSSSVLFDDAGAPVLTSFGDSEIFTAMPEKATGFSVSPALLMQQSAVAADLSGLVATCLTTLDSTSDIARWLSTSLDRDHASFAHELADRLFQSARAAPINFATSFGEKPSALIPSRVESHASRVDSESTPAAQHEITTQRAIVDPHPLAINIASFLHVPDGMVNTLLESSHRILERSPVSSLIQRIRKMLGPVRKPVWIIAAIVASSVVAAAAILPSHGGGDSAQSHQPSPLPTPTFAAPLTDAAILGDDPLAAATALLDLRDDCIIEHSVLCFDSVNQQGSAAMDSDSTQVRLLQDGGAPDGSLVLPPSPNGGASMPRHVSLMERLGDSVLLSISFDAPNSDAAPEGAATQAASFSLLIIKGDEGWRIRDLVPMADAPY